MKISAEELRELGLPPRLRAVVSERPAAEPEPQIDDLPELRESIDVVDTIAARLVAAAAMLGQPKDEPKKPTSWLFTVHRGADGLIDTIDAEPRYG